MSEPKDPERLLADALRAQAVFAPQADRVPPAEPPASATATGGGTTGAGASIDSAPTEAVPTATAGPAEMPSAYGLLSGAGADSLERERAALDLAEGTARTTQVPRLPIDQPTVRQRPVTGTAPLPAYWILLLALLLGLAAGSVVGLLTLV